MASKFSVKRKTRVKLPSSLGRGAQVKVGFPASKTDGDVIDRAIFNHFGTSRGIPARPFLLNAMRSNKAKYSRLLKHEAKDILLGKMALFGAISRLGIIAQGDIQSEITTLRSPPNAPSTIASKGSSNPLIDTGEMRQAVTYLVIE